MESARGMVGEGVVERKCCTANVKAWAGSMRLVCDGRTRAMGMSFVRPRLKEHKKLEVRAAMPVAQQDLAFVFCSEYKSLLA
eukprot:6178269-Pleurochrysis_carterae.AAC.1